MVGMMDHAQAAELLGAYALDAVDPDEAAAIEQHLETCPRCRDELRGHREVVGLLANAGEEAPEGLWARVVAGINESESQGGGSAGAQLSLRVVREGDGGGGEGGRAGVGGDVGTGGEGRAAGGGGLGAAGDGGATAPGPTQPHRWRSRPGSLLALPAAAAVIVVALLGVQVVRLQDRTNRLSGEVASMSGQPTMAAVQRALRTPGAKVVSLAPPAGGPAALEAVILPGGQGYLFDAKLGPLSPAQTYQLWGVVGDQKISYGVLGPTPAQVMAFRASSGVQALAVTAEVAGGVVTSTARPVAVGLIS